MGDSEQARRITGTVDRLVESTLVGWADDGHEHDRLSVSVWLGDRLVGSGKADLAWPGLERPVAYAIKLDPVPTAAEIVSDKFRVEVGSAAGERMPLPIAPHFLAEAGARAAGDGVAKLPTPDLLRLVANEMVRRPAEHPFARRVPEVQGNQFSSFLLPLGHVSANGVAVVGRDGQLFLMGGSNDLVGQYRDGRGSAEIAAEADGWNDLFVRRAEALESRGITYRQLVIPEKSTIIPDYFPVPIETPTPLFEAIEARVASGPIADAYVPLLQPMLGHPKPIDLFRGVHSHLSAEGFFFIFAQLMASLGHDLPEIRFEEELVSIGDLGLHFGGLPLCSVDRKPAATLLERYGAEIERVEVTKSSGHLGARSITRNPGAPIDAKVMVFGNSYFTFGGTVHCTSYWMERWFREYHFIWTPEIDFDRVDAVRPDIVVGQTIERFLPRRPHS